MSIICIFIRGVANNFFKRVSVVSGHSVIGKGSSIIAFSQVYREYSSLTPSLLSKSIATIKTVDTKVCMNNNLCNFLGLNSSHLLALSFDLRCQ